MAKTLTLTETAARILVHLQRFEADPAVNVEAHHPGLHPYFNVHCLCGGQFVRVCYVSYQGWSPLTRGQALAYLNWLDQGNVGKHFQMERGQ